MHYSNQRLSHFTSVCFAGPRPCTIASTEIPKLVFAPYPHLIELPLNQIFAILRTFVVSKPRKTRQLVLLL